MTYAFIDSTEDKTTSSRWLVLGDGYESLFVLTHIYIFTYLIMIDVMRLDGKKYWVNPHMIESMENTPDLTRTMLSGRKIIVKNSPEDLIENISAYRREICIERQEVL